MFQSEELKNAPETAPSITYISPQAIDLKSIKDELKKCILYKNIDLIKSYDFGALNRNKTVSSGETLKIIMNMIKDLYILTYKEDTNKCLIIKKLFDNITNSLDCLLVNGSDISSDEINTAILGYLNKNFL